MPITACKSWDSGVGFSSCGLFMVEPMYNSCSAKCPGVLRASPGGLGIGSWLPILARLAVAVVLRGLTTDARMPA